MPSEPISVLQILPKVPPAVCGVGDYAWGLARSLKADHGIHSSFLCADTSWQEPAGGTEFPVQRLPFLSAGHLVDFLKQRTDEFSSVILHMSSYGFQKRGVPLWLANAWEKIALLPDRPRLLTMFHELAASGPVTSSAFWLRPLQQWVMRRIALASDGLRTNREGYAAWLRSIPGMKGREVVALPVYSNFGEPNVLPKWLEREPAMIMFAWPLAPGESPREYSAKALGHARRFGLHKLHVIGGKNGPEGSLPDIELVRHGFMPPEDISKLLLGCRLAYTAYNPLYFGKSTLMASFASHGLVVITRGQAPSLPDGLHDGVQVLNEGTLSIINDPLALPLDDLAASLRNWYDGHSLEKNAESYANQIFAVRSRV